MFFINNGEIIILVGLKSSSLKFMSSKISISGFSRKAKWARRPSLRSSLLVKEIKSNPKTLTFGNFCFKTMATLELITG